ncbi:MAG: tetratricopeptide repeat protein [Pseudomonadota bacterium]
MRLSRVELGFLGALTLLVAWVALSATWSRSTPSSILEGQRALVYLAAAAAFLLAGTRSSVRSLLGGVLAGVTAVGVGNVVLRLVGDADPSVLHPEARPVGYVNGLAILLVLGIAVGAGLAATGATRREQLAAAAPASFLLVPLGLLGSKGAWLALGVGLGCAAVLRYARSPLAFPAAVAIGLSVTIAVGVRFNEQRASYWRAATAEVRAEPVHGTGAGTFGRVWLTERRAAVQAHDAHNLYLETLGETGPVGLALLAAVLAIPIASAAAVRRHPLAPAAAAPYAAFLVHAGIDWDWELAAVTVAAIACACGLLLLGRPRAPAAEVGPRGRFALVVAASLLGLVALGGLGGTTAVARAADAAGDGSWATAEVRARRATRLAPWSAEAWRILGEAQQEQGEADAARRSLRRAVEKDPSDPDLWLALANSLRGNARARAVAQALRLNPLGVAPE